MPTEEQEKSVEKYENELIKLIYDEIDYEKTENMAKLQKRIMNKKTDEKETIRHLTCEFKNLYENPKLVKFKTNRIIGAEINEQDRVLITDENYPIMPQEGIVVQKKQKEIIIEYCNDNFLKRALPELCRIDLYVKESTYNRQLENLENLTPNGKYALHFALNHENPKNNNKIKNINFYDPELNIPQREAVEKSLNSKHFFLIHGPFGTGKTKTLIEIIRQEALVKEKILVTADSNAAVDNIAERLKDTDLKIIRVGNDKKINKEIKEYSLSIQTKKHPLYQKIEENKNSLSDLYEKLNEKDIEPQEVNNIKFKIKQKNEENNELYSHIHKDIIDNHKIILTTNTSASLDMLADYPFEVAIIDEASQTTIPSVLIPIAKASKFILAGDPKQLPPTVTSNNNELKKTLFEILQKNFPQQQRLLNVQNRMNEILMEFPNKEFYNNKLKCGEEAKNYFLKKNEDPYHHKSPILFIDTSFEKNNNESQYKNSTSIYNTLESKIASKIAKRYHQSGIPKSEIGIITPYVDQVNLIKKHTSVNVDTVDGFQGNEKDIIIISMVRSGTTKDIQFVADSKRLNVTLTRARKKLIIIGNTKTLKQKKIYKKMIKFCKNNNALRYYDKNLF
ncbi:AAA domain-containing protein [Methanobrevibacter sp.]|uniref:AAA domain-containing protein n=1 Tax=Methanobrevibacter sp. TaxID=66852 RepID=UPI003870E847